MLWKTIFPKFWKQNHVSNITTPKFVYFRNVCTRCAKSYIFLTDLNHVAHAVILRIRLAVDCERSDNFWGRILRKPASNLTCDVKTSIWGQINTSFSFAIYYFNVLATRTIRKPNEGKRIFKYDYCFTYRFNMMDRVQTYHCVRVMVIE